MGVSNNNADDVLRMNERKKEICGVKIFMGSSTGNMLVDRLTTLNKIFGESELLIATHCEDENIIKANYEKLKKQKGELSPSDHPLIRNEEACYRSSSFAVSLAKKHNIVTLIDNSYCTPLFQKPIPLGIDLCMQTATKYIGGHSDTLGGVLTGSQAAIKRVFDSEYLNIGSGISPFNAWLLLRGLRTLPVRLAQISETTKAVMGFLKNHPKIDQVLFPLDESFPQYQLAKQQMAGAASLLTITLKEGTLQCITAFCESLKRFLIAVSWGGHESLVIPKCAGVKEADFDAANIEHQYIRLYTGLEEAEYLIADLRQALDRI
jgi:cystathionine beta-lyase/cystathionine gamma-synthase